MNKSINIPCIIRIIGTAALMFFAAFIIQAQAKDVKIKKKDVPPDIISAFIKAYPKAVIKGTSKETEKGITYYEIESVDGKIHRDLLYTSDGVVHETEETIDAKALPNGAQKVLSDKYSKAKIVKVEKVTSDSTSGYEVKIKIGGKTKGLNFDEQGNLKKAEKKESKNEKDEKEEDEEND